MKTDSQGYVFMCTDVDNFNLMFADSGLLFIVILELIFTLYLSYCNKNRELFVKFNKLLILFNEN